MDNVEATGSPVPQSTTDVSMAPSPPRRHTRSQSGIVKEKQYSDGTIKYNPTKRAFLATIGEPINLHDALASKDWKEAMDN